MQTNIIEISGDNRELSVRRGFICIKEHGKTISEIPTDSICAIMITGRAVVYTQSLMAELCSQNIPLIIIGNNFCPTGILLPLIGQTKQMEVQQIQINTSKPLTKQLWKTVVQTKIKNQSTVLDYFGKNNKIKKLSAYVQSGDTGNIEGIAARMYFQSLFGGSFIRNPDFNGINSFLNYGYAILRSTVARLVVATGLNPSFGIQHHNKLNPLCLVDDLMEPYRPIVDKIVYEIFSENTHAELTPENKAKLAGILNTEIKTKSGYSPLINIIQRNIWDFIKSLKEKKNKLEYENVIQN